MAYYTGSANDMAAVRDALVNACTGEGWAWNGDTGLLSKSPSFLRLQLVDGYLQLTGRTSAAAGDAPHVVQMGPFSASAFVESPLPLLTYPLKYELFVFAQEVYCVINYSVDVYQWCAFGQSTVQGLPGTGMWVGASAADTLTNYVYGVNLTPVSGGSAANSYYFCPALFWSTDAAMQESMVHSNLDGRGWLPVDSESYAAVGISAAQPLIGLLPNTWSSEAVLLPIRAYQTRPSNKISMTADLQHARYTRIDHYSPGQVITIGSDRWKILPFFRKNSAQRNGGSNHTGTFGWAIRYEGP